MKLEAISARIAPRTAWQAMDLGTHLFRHWWWPLLQVWLLFSLPLLLLALWLNQNSDMLLGWLLFWWLKPALERPLLEFSARALFAEQPSLRQLLREFPRYALPGLLSWLSWRRIYWNRSVLVPVRQLEQLRGTELLRREQVLEGAIPSRAMWLTVIMVHIEQLASYALVVSLMMLLPNQQDLDSVAWYFETEQYPYLSMIGWYLVLCVTQPLYVTCGFALYLNQRTWREGWDLEIGLRQIGQRRHSSGALIALLLVLMVSFSLPEAHAESAEAVVSEATDGDPPDTQVARDHAISVVASPAFQPIESEGHWRLKQDADSDSNSSDYSWLGRILRALLEASIDTGKPDRINFYDLFRVLLWALVISLLVWLLWHYRHWLAQLRLPGPSATARPTHIQGLDIRRSSLPDNVADSATALLARRDYRQLLSLLLRSSLSRLLDRQAVTLPAGATEQECLATLRQHHHDSTGIQLLSEIVHHWLTVAWGHQSADATALTRLLQRWRAHFEDAQTNDAHSGSQA